MWRRSARPTRKRPDAQNPTSVDNFYPPFYYQPRPPYISPCSSVFDESEAAESSGDDFSSISTMSSESLPSAPSSRSLTVSIPLSQLQAQGRRPNLREILANTAPSPWTLSAFMAYLSQNHCLETLEFTMDATRYRKRYHKMSSRSAESRPTSLSDSPSSRTGSPVSPPPSGDETAYVKMLWRRLMDAYIVPNGPREVNLPGDVRDTLLSLSPAGSEGPPPSPLTLETAVEKTYELMEESVLVPFLNSVAPPVLAPEDTVVMTTESSRTSSHGSSHSHSHGHSHGHSYTRSYDDRSRASSQEHDTPAPPHSAHPASSSASIFSSRLSQNSSSSTPRGRASHYRFSSRSTNKHTPVTSAASTTVSSTLTSLSSSLGIASISPMPENAGLADEPAVASGVPACGSPANSTVSIASDLIITPPITPPTSEYGGNASHNGSVLGVSHSGSSTPSPRNSRVDPIPIGGPGSVSAASWRRMGQRLGFKKRGPSYREDEEMSGME